MFENKAGAVMSAKRLKRHHGVPLARGRELVARAAGYHDWHHLERTAGTSSAPTTPRDSVVGKWPAAMEDYALRHDLLPDADRSAVLKTISPESNHVTTNHTTEEPDHMSITITETAAIILDALHAGCTAVTADGNGMPMERALIEPYNVAPVNNMMDEEWSIRRVGHQRTRHSSRTMRRVDKERMERIDVWGRDETEASQRDMAMLVRGGLVNVDKGGDVAITKTGRGVAQARIGNGVVITDNAATPLAVQPSTSFTIGEPDFFQEMQQEDGEAELTLYSIQGKPAFKAKGFGHVAYSSVEPAVARTIAGMMADAGKVDRDTSATFGPVRITLHQGGDVTFAFGHHLAVADARVSKVQARTAKAYLVELAKGAETSIVIAPASVKMGIRHLVKPDALSGWNDIAVDEDDA